MTIEICANSLASARAAQAGGAQRIELCTRLEVGGLTPSLSEIKQAVATLSIPVFVLVRPRAGDFCYSVDELEQMRQSIVDCKAAGAAGVVIGVLRPDHSVDTDAMRKLIALARPLAVTFHRAFDRVTKPIAALEALIKLGVDRILTSGQAPVAPQGAPLLQKLIQRAGKRLIILPGSGINARNAAALAAYTGAQELHLSAKMTLPDGQWQSDEAEVRRVVETFRET